MVPHSVPESLVRRFGVAVAVGLVAAGLLLSGAARASAVTCKRTPLPNVGSDNELRGVSVTSSRNAWAVGDYYTASDQERTLIEHWNGKAWKIQTSPNRGAYSRLSGVAATSSTNAWAVGYSYLSSRTNYATRTLIEHWNGRSWKIQASPKLARTKHIRPVLNGVAATSSTNAWAVGSDSHGGVIEHWNGKAWKVQASPNRGAYSWLSGVAATSSRNAWAVGDYYTASDQERTLIEHWNGKAWKIQASPNPSFHLQGYPLAYIPLTGVAATSSTNAWVVGYSDVDFDERVWVTRTLIEHWNGRSWKIQPSPNELVSPPWERVDDFSVGSQFYGVAATSSTDAWAVGWPIKGASIWQSNGGKAWKAQASPKRGAALYAVAAKSSNIWAVGADYGTAYQRIAAFEGNGGGPVKGLAVHCVSSSSG